ncbi:Dihydropteroate synthase [Bacteroides luti]|uniref:dihydropteroate synthase n=1 Tax=Bacteroides luti TaxID=1297750 RepID=A0A1M5A5K5_9BACE|nr:dihydropteroate synthase [Bacteroides luti]SHF25551.1 Dihydropteroate synthase [Bacteroides luti]
MISQSLSKYINVNGRLLDLSTPQVMGVLNVTPDSFYSGCRAQTDEAIADRARQILEEGASIIDIGAYSSRPNCVDISPEEELNRLRYALKILNEVHPDAIISVDTFRASVAEVCVKEYGVAIINDISGGEMDKNMFDTVIDLQVPYIMQHMQGTPQNMQDSPHYDNLMRETFLYFSEKIQMLHDRGLNDIILDPGFGFGKTLDHNYELLSHLEEFKIFELPILVGLSRKSMITKLLDIPTTEALNGTTVTNTIALMKGADIIRVHDVKETVQAVKIVQKCRNL